MSPGLVKYTKRLGIAGLIYLFFKITSPDSPDTSSDYKSIVLFAFAVVVVLVVWEVCDRVLYYSARRFPHDLTSNRRISIIFLTAILATFPIVIAFLYFENYYLKVWLECVINPFEEFINNTIQAFVISLLVITAEIVKLYYEHSRQIERDKALIQKELMQAKFESLKNQINPHFLFNNLSVLTSLIHKDPDLASDFVSQFSKMYRYILDNKQNQMVTLEKEFDFLDTYLFLLKTRHENSIAVNIKVDFDKTMLYVPTLSLQMLIENAVKHNSFSPEFPLEISIYNEGEDYLVVHNRVKSKTSAVSSTKIGLENIRKRYDLQSEKKVIVEQNVSYFKVKLPMISSFNPI